MSKISVKERIRRAKQAGGATRPVRVYLGPDMGVVDRYQDAVAELEKIEETGDSSGSVEGNPAKAAARQKVDELRAQVDALDCLELTVRALSDDEWQALVDAHPPRRTADNEVDPRDADTGWNMTTFPRALARASTVAPALDDQDWLDLLGTADVPGVLTHSQIDKVSFEVFRLSRRPLDIPFS